MQAEVPAEIRQQQTLFSDPVSKLWEKMDALAEEEKIVKEMETDYPVETEELIESLKDLQKQVKESKERHLEELKEDADYQAAIKRKAEVSLEVDELAIEVKKLVADNTDENGMLDILVTVDGTDVRLQAEKNMVITINDKKI